MKNILVTGGAGFIGSNFIHHLLSAADDIRVINLDALTYAGNPKNLEDCMKDTRYHFVYGDIRDRTVLNSIFREFKIDTVVHFAAESHVDRSVTDPGVFVSTNVLGTQALLDAAKAFWNLEPVNKYSQQYRSNVRFLQVSTDEVYGALGPDGAFSETTPLAPNSPYSASKASADLLVLAYHKTYGLPVNITRCSNNYGPNQFPEKLIPLMICKAAADQPLPVYGDGLQIRDWLHVSDHCTAIETVLKHGKIGEIYNIGGHSEKTNLEIIRLILKEMGKPESLVAYVQDRPGHDRRYAIDNTKITKELGWRPSYTFETGIRETIQWYLENQEWLESIEKRSAL